MEDFSIPKKQRYERSEHKNLVDEVVNQLKGKTYNQVKLILEMVELVVKDDLILT